MPSTIGGSCCAPANGRAWERRSFSGIRAASRATCTPRCLTTNRRRPSAVALRGRAKHRRPARCRWARFRCRPIFRAPTGAGWNRTASDTRPSSRGPPAQSRPRPPDCISPNRCWPKSAARGVQVCFLTLHVGLGTFAPVKAETLAAHTMHEERYELSEETARAINEAKAAGRRVIAVGTTTRPRAGNPRRSSRSLVTRHRSRRRRQDPHLHSSPLRVQNRGRAPDQLPPAPLDAADARQRLRRAERHPGARFVLSAYAEAIRERYRFFSYGDAMLIL